VQRLATNYSRTPPGAARRAAVPQEDDRPQVTRHPRRVLIVEDNIDAVRSMAFLLRDMGHRVEYAINGYAGLEIARRFDPEFVFLDLGLPGMDGFELCKRMKRDPALRGARVIAVTGYAQEDYRLRALESGCELHFVKPLHPKVLAALLG
jgi:CheY-like chemotaxis protein